MEYTVPGKFRFRPTRKCLTHEFERSACKSHDYDKHTSLQNSALVGTAKMAKNSDERWHCLIFALARLLTSRDTTTKTHCLHHSSYLLHRIATRIACRVQLRETMRTAWRFTNEGRMGKTTVRYILCSQEGPFNKLLFCQYNAKKGRMLC